MKVYRTPDDRFDGLPDYDFAPNYLVWNGLRVHHLDEGPRNGQAILMLHGEPTWSFLYRRMVKTLSAAGYRCIAPDHVGFGRSDKVMDDDWYVLERHVERIRHLIEILDLRDVILVVQDWGGPIGLINAVSDPSRFARLVILNTWLHRPDYPYTDQIHAWRRAAVDPARWRTMPVQEIMQRTLVRGAGKSDAILAAYEAPYEDQETRAGLRRFPFCLPFAEPVAGGAALQETAFRALAGLPMPKHVMFGDSDPIFPAAHGEAWARQLPGATFDIIKDAGHFLQEDAGPEIAARMLERFGSH
jgi:haloalkane dehalogenase